MASGQTTTVTLADSMAQMRQSARIQHEGATGFHRTVRRESLGKGEGDSWNEVVLGKLQAQTVGQGQRLNNPQQLTDTLFAIVPETRGVHVIYTIEMQNRISRNVFGKAGAALQNALDRQLHLDGLTLYDGATYSQPGAGNTLTSGNISAIVSQIWGNTTENPDEGDPIYSWLNPYQAHDLTAEVGAPIGTYTITPGPSQEAYQRGLKAIQVVGGAEIKLSTNVRVDSSDDAHGGVHAKSMIVLVEEEIPRTFAEDLSDMAGARALWMYRSYGYGQVAVGTGYGRILSDALAPTS